MDGVSSSRFKFDAIGTSWEIDTPAPLAAEIQEYILDMVERFDSVYSRFRDDSIVTRTANATNGGTFDFPADAIPMFDLFDRLHAMTDGAVDPLVGRDLELLGYDRQCSLTPQRMEVGTSHPTWYRDVIRDGSRLTTRRPLVIDLGAVGKGALVDSVSELLLAAGLEDFIVDGSGDIRHRGSHALEVGLEHPLDPGAVIGVASLSNASICASATNRRTWGNGLHHVIDARTGMPTSDVIATWVIAADTATADGLATALFFDATQPLMATYDFSFVRMFADGHLEVSDNFEGVLFT
ncbi:FAD:protein FMN transferase [Aliirhizobium cellulosilyticum]|uniref:FAD:protein FMN transferase n=1 Tax=Aliirhizobium cellulosilyticum TaxID=393664 RepID=A0A7W6TIC6_9HYPH|nr:FAD:protein FMN transferase [Rhizobium cellulosilyticum]MBB4350737.1 thiamine biosynthesis lipoprotein [Rhizobium cellulosilyticum]MBB4413932.1 thiamine biosynthesis lipoprotein [Rhizobium cellulosilyticum]MBB4448547.1 thiamine biosynthesis lipoprotein [Rhizobium cellulosilyticum]